MSDVQHSERYVLIQGKSYKKYIKWIGIIIAFALLAYLTYICLKKEKTSDVNQKVKNEHQNKEQYKAVLINYCASWCKASIDFWPVWDRFTEELSKYRPDIQTITMVCDKDDNDTKCNNAGIQAYPTVILYQDGKTIPFEGSRTILNLHEFIRLNTYPVKY
jgi:thioredoxin-like negative regulator of GroEL